MSPDRTAPQLVEIRLHGALRRRFGKSYHLAVRSAAEAVRALCVVLPGFKQHMVEHSAPGYRVWLGPEPISSTDQLQHPPGKLIRIVPVTAGAGGDGELGQVLLGAALIGLSFVPFLGTVTIPLLGSLSSIAFSIGVGMVLGGVSQMLAGSPQSTGPAERPENQPSYAFNGVVNTTGQGNPVPILYGHLRIGSQVASAGLSVSQISTGQEPGGGGGGDTGGGVDWSDDGGTLDGSGP